MNLEIENKKALVCGSTQGIGKATAIALANEGVNVTLIARNKTSLEAVINDLPNSSNHNYIVADFSKPLELKASIENYIAKNGGFHILVNNTGGPGGGPIENATLEQFTTAFEMHLLCNQILAQANLEFMKTEQFGRIINVISTSVKEPIEGLGVSNTIGNAVANWAKTLAGEVAKYGITVNNVLPGFTDTARLHQIIDIKAKKEQTTVEQMTSIMKNYVPAKRFAQPEETASAIAFLSSSKAAYITGINVPVDGGRTKSL